MCFIYLNSPQTCREERLKTGKWFYILTQKQFFTLYIYIYTYINVCMVQAAQTPFFLLLFGLFSRRWVKEVLWSLETEKRHTISTFKWKSRRLWSRIIFILLFLYTCWPVSCCDITGVGVVTRGLFSPEFPFTFISGKLPQTRHIAPAVS